MDRQTPVPGEFYQHFKGMIYQIRCLAEHSESGDLLVIYQALYGDFRIYARPLDQFLSEVDRLNYPTASARYRFTKIDPGQLNSQQTNPLPPEPEHSQPPATDSLPLEDFSEEKTPEALFFMFLDAESSRERLEVLALLKKNLTRQMADSLAASMDLVLPGQSIEEDVELIEDHIRTRAKFETRW